MKRLITIFLFGTLLFTAVLSLSLVAAVFLLHTESAHLLLQSKINENIPGTITWTKYKVSLFSGRLEIENLSLKDRAGEDIISLPYLLLNISWLDIPYGILMFDSILLENPKVRLSEDETDELNLIKSLFAEDQPTETSSEPDEKSTGTSFPANIKIGKADIRGGDLQYHINPDHRIILPNIDIEIKRGNLMRREISFSGDIAGGEVDFGTIRTGFGDVFIKGKLAGDDLSFFSINLHTKAGSRIFTSGRILDIYNRLQPDLEVEIDGEMNDILGVFSLQDKAYGAISAKASMKGSLENPSIRLSAGYRNADVSGTKFDQAEVVCRLEKGVVNIEQASLRIPVGVLQLNGNVDLQKVLPNGFLSDDADIDDIAYDLNGSFNAAQTKPESTFLDGVTGILRSTFVLSGEGVSASARSGRISQEIFIQRLGKEGAFEITDTSLSAIIDYKQQNMDIVKLLLTIGGKQSLSGVGKIDIVSGLLEGDFSSTLEWPLKEIVIHSVENLKGGLKMTAHVAGTIEKPMINGFLHARDFSYQDYCLESFVTDYMFSGESIYFDGARIQNLQSALHLSGVLHLKDSNRSVTTPNLDFSIRGDNILLEDFWPELKGSLSIAGSIFGEVTHPEGNILITGENFNIYGQKAKAADLKMRADQEKLYVDQGTIVISENEEIQTNGWVSFYQEKYDLRVVSNGISLNNIESISMKDWGAAKLNLSLSGQGSFENPACSGEVGVTSLIFNGNRFDPFAAGIRFSDWKIEVHETRENALTAEVDFKTGEINVRAQMDHIQLSPWLKLAGMDDLSGHVDMRLQLSGKYTALEDLYMSTVFSNLQVLWDEKELLYASRLSFGMEKGLIRIPKNRLLFAENGFLDIMGTADVSGLIDVGLTGQLSAKMIEMFTDEISGVSGLFLVDAGIGGNWEKPQVRSTVEIRKVQGSFPYLSENVSEINGVVTMTPDMMISLEEIQGRFGNGWARLNGIIGLQTYPKITTNLSLKSHALPVEIPDLNLFLNSDLFLKFDQEKQILSGEIVILEGVYYRNVDINPISIVVEKSRKEEILPDRTEQSFIDKIELDISVKSRNPFVVDNNISLLQLKPNFHIRGSVERPVFTGRAEVESGMIAYQKREFEVTRGVVDFINPYKVEPSIDLEGKTQIRTWKIFLAVTGVPENLKITLWSEPALQDGDILSLLVFGKTVQEFIEGEGGQSNSPAELLAGLVTERLQKDVKEATGLDSVQVGYRSNGTESDSSQVKVEVGKDLSRQVTVKYGIETMNSKIVQRAITEYRFLENVMLQAYQNSEGDYGGELQYRLEFR